MKCTICNKNIILIPSAKQRASNDISGKSARYYTRLFTEHVQCAVDKREKETVSLMLRLQYK
jgi:hypothetical protein